MLGKGHFLQWGRAYLPGEIFFIVCKKDPEQIKQGIGGPEIPVLVPVDLMKFLCRTKAKEWPCFDIIIHAINVRIGMLDDIMLGSPHEIIST